MDAAVRVFPVCGAGQCSGDRAAGPEAASSGPQRRPMDWSKGRMVRAHASSDLQPTPMEQPSSSSAYGFLTVVDSPTHGLFGGYLLVDAAGRPLEFHCTAPVKVSRAQQILYGATLQGHLHGQQIGAALLAEASVEPLVVLTDLDSMLAVRPHTDLPVALVTRADAAAGFELGTAKVTAAGADPAAETVLRERLEPLAAVVDLHEPFDRIRAAIEEAQRH